MIRLPTSTGGCSNRPEIDGIWLSEAAASITYRTMARI